MFTFTITLDRATAARIDRILDLLEGKQQAEIDQATSVLAAVAEELRESTVRLAAATSESKLTKGE